MLAAVSCGATAGCSREPTVAIRENADLRIPAATQAADKIWDVLRSDKETEAALRRYAILKPPHFLATVDFRREVVIICPDAEIVGVGIEPFSGLGVVSVGSVATPGVGIAVASGKDVEKLGKFTEEKPPPSGATPGQE